MGTEKKQPHYPGFAHPASALSAWAFSIDVFIISLKGGKLVRHTPEDAEAFRQWLQANSIRNVHDDDK